MNWIKSFALLACATLMFVGCKNAENTPDETAATLESDAPEVLATASFTIEGMHCEHGCAGTIKKKLAKMDGVKEVEIDFEGKKATIVYDANKQTPEAFVEKVLSIDKTYVVSEVTNSSDKAYMSDKNKDKKKKAEKEAEANKANTETSTKSCSGEKKAGCCSKKAETL
ncbi:MAG: heavy-metal-associated domain-containing protein [Flavobacterium sp.]